AAVLSLLIRDQYPDVICFAFSPPGGLVSLSLSIYLQEFVLSCFLGMDVVARLGVINMEKLKKDLLAVIKNSRLPKYKILSSGLLSMCCGCLPVSDDALLDDTQTIKLSGSVNSDWEHVTWTGDKDSLAMFDGETEETDYLSRQSSVKTMEPSGGFKDEKAHLVNKVLRVTTVAVAAVVVTVKLTANTTETMMILNWRYQTRMLNGEGNRRIRSDVICLSITMHVSS
ncbi:hypothetical protein LSH36_26g07022, partial [Paralvinella palmiformis]